MNIEKQGIPTVCLITTAFQTIAEGQQKALGYPELPFVMLEHPVAVATDDEIEAKVEAVYPELVRKLTGGVASTGETTPEQKKDNPEDPSTGKIIDIDEVIAPIRNMLQADGADLAIISWKNGDTHMKLIFSDQVCEECILPREDLADMILAACRNHGLEASRMVLEDPREEN